MYFLIFALAWLSNCLAAELGSPLPLVDTRRHEAARSTPRGHAAAGDHAQRPLLASVGRVQPYGPSQGLPAYKHGQYTVVEQDGTVCPSYGERQWTGTIDVTDTRRLFFWAFESRNDPARDPVIFWMNGGPGSSSLLGALTELGACMLQNDSSVPEANPWSWNNNATLVFLDQPAGVGFSSVAQGAKLPGTDADGAPDFQEFLNIFFRHVFPEKAHLPIHIAAESYGGHYGPVYLHHILESRRHNAAEAFWGNITSLILVNAVIDFGGPVRGTYAFFCENKVSRGVLTQAQCEAILAKMPMAEKLARECGETLDPDICLASFSYYAENLSRYYDVLVEKGERSPYHLFRGCPDPPDCSNTERGNYTEFLNQRDVKKILGFPETYVFRGNNQEINDAYSKSGSHWVPTTPHVAAVLNAYHAHMIVDKSKAVGDIRLMVLNGNLDPGINTQGNIIQFDSVIWRRMGEYRAAKWHDLAQENVSATGSFKGTSDGRLVFIAVDGAGHMVPSDVPEASFKIVQRWLERGW